MAFPKLQCTKKSSRKLVFDVKGRLFEVKDMLGKLDDRKVIE